MNGPDWNLRDLLETATGEPPRDVTVQAVRRQAARRRAARAAAVTVAAAMITGLGVALASGAIRVGGLPPAVGHQHAGPPRFYLTQIWDQKSRTTVLAVRATATGRVTATIASPLAGAHCGGGNVDFAAADHQTFFFTCVKGRSARPSTVRLRSGIRRMRPGRILFIETLIYRFHVTGSGRVTGISPVPGGVLKGVWADTIAAAPDGSAVAAEVLRPVPPGLLYTNTVPAGIVVIDTRTGARAFWHTGPYVPGTLQYAGGHDLSFTRDGRELVVLEARCHRSRYLASCNGHADMQVRAFNPASRGGTLEGGQLLLSGGSLSDAFITPDGSAVNAALVACPRHGTCTLSVERISISTGRVERLLYRTHTGTPYAGVFFRFFGSDPSGRYLILDAGAGTARVNGWIDDGRLVPLVPANGNDASYETWSRP